MFELNIGSTPNTLTPPDFKALAERTKGYSGSDIAVVVRDALMEPVRKVLSATHFKPVQVPNENPPPATITKYTPCSPGDPDAVERSWNDVSGDELLEPPLGLQDFMRAVNAVRPTVTDDDIKRHIEWTNDSGLEGA